MSFELMIHFSSNDLTERSRVKASVIAWLESRGVSDFVDGFIDGIEMPLTEAELQTGLTSEDRLESSPVAVYHEYESNVKAFWSELNDEFGSHIHGAISQIDDQSWQNCWLDEFSPYATQRFFIAPLGHPLETPLGLTRVEIDASGGAFGTGQHATTRAVIAVLESEWEAWSPRSVLDVGTGTGIYLILCGLLGAENLEGTEISAELLEIAQSNCEIANVESQVFLATDLKPCAKSDLIIANILVPVLHDLMPQFSETLNPGGRLLLAGFVEKEQAALVHRAQQCGFKLVSDTHDTGWKCLVFKRS